MRQIFLLITLLVLTGCAGRSFIPEPTLAPAGERINVQYLLPPSLTESYEVLPDPAPFADDQGFQVTLRPRGATTTITIAGGNPARPVWEQHQPVAGSDRVKATLLRGAQGVMITDPDLITMAWVEQGVPYFVSVTTADNRTVQIFVNALAVYDLSGWKDRVGL
ncbi:hypothetical protein [Chloroflexus sp.]|uniref:hypothetical protein n=1 Tax=Chloroflexus sp. TaxID=1904827 RepID=UPI00262321DD|nr:hypothetical protein [uncultured Chloroflexus sp.]